MEKMLSNEPLDSSEYCAMICSNRQAQASVKLREGDYNFLNYAPQDQIIKCSPNDDIDAKSNDVVVKSNTISSHRSKLILSKALDLNKSNISQIDRKSLKRKILKDDDVIESVVKTKQKKIFKTELLKTMSNIGKVSNESEQQNDIILNDIFMNEFCNSNIIKSDLNNKLGEENSNCDLTSQDIFIDESSPDKNGQSSVCLNLSDWSLDDLGLAE